MIVPNSLVADRAADNAAWTNRQLYTIRSDEDSGGEASVQLGNDKTLPEKYGRQVKLFKCPSQGEISLGLPSSLLGKCSNDSGEVDSLLREDRKHERRPSDGDAELTPYLMSGKRRMTEPTSSQEDEESRSGVESAGTGDTNKVPVRSEAILYVLKKPLSGGRTLRDWSSQGPEHIPQNISEDSETPPPSMRSERSEAKSVVALLKSGHETIFTSDASTAYMSDGNDTSSCGSFSEYDWRFSKRQHQSLQAERQNKDHERISQIYPLWAERTYKWLPLV